MHPDNIPPQPGGVRAGTAVVLGFLLVGVLGVGWYYLTEIARLQNWSRKTEVVPPLPAFRVGLMVPGVETPPMRPPTEAGLADDAPVVGIKVGEQARAYALISMRSPMRHIVNDIVGGRAVTVTYCDLSDCTRAFGGVGKADPLDISQAGTFGTEMLLKVGHVTYMQATGKVYEPDPGFPSVPFPFQDYPLVRTTWGEWKAGHPMTDVYVYRDGDPNPKIGDPLPAASTPRPGPGH